MIHSSACFVCTDIHTIIFTVTSSMHQLGYTLLCIHRSLQREERKSCQAIDYTHILQYMYIYIGGLVNAYIMYELYFTLSL